MPVAINLNELLNSNISDNIIIIISSSSLIRTVVMSHVHAVVCEGVLEEETSVS